MFGYCHSLTSIDISNFVTTKVRDFQGMFFSCFKLKRLQVSHFDITQATILMSMFGFGYSMEYINMSTFVINPNINYKTMFDNHYEKMQVCLTDIPTELLLVPQLKYYFNYDCSPQCFPKQYKYDLCRYVCSTACDQSECIYDYKHVCYPTCPNTTYEPDEIQYICEDKVEGEAYYYNTERKLFKKCHYKCKTCNQRGMIQIRNVLNAKMGIYF